jgi:hypothetical protein
MGGAGNAPPILFTDPNPPKGHRTIVFARYLAATFD